MDPSRTPSLLIAIPAYNEASVVARVVAAARAVAADYAPGVVVVVDDGSADDTAEVARAAGAVVLRHLINQGVGAATGTALAYARDLGHDLTVMLDADEQHDAAELHALVAPILAGSADMVVGSRMLDPAGMPALRRVGNRGLSLITRLLYGGAVSDSQSGYRAYGRRAVELLRVRARGFEVCSELLWEARRHHLRVVEVPIRTIYTEYSQTKGQPIWNGFNIVGRLVARRLRG